MHVRSFSKSARAGPPARRDERPGALIGEVHHLRQLGQGWSSRLLQRVLLDLLTDERSTAAVAAAREEYARRRRAFVDALAARDVVVGGDDGLNLWVPVYDEAAALVRLASRGIGVAPGAPFNVLPDSDGHVRATVGLVGTDLDAVADEVAAAARDGGLGELGALTGGTRDPPPGITAASRTRPGPTRGSRSTTMSSGYPFPDTKTSCTTWRHPEAAALVEAQVAEVGGSGRQHDAAGSGEARLALGVVEEEAPDAAAAHGRHDRGVGDLPDGF